MHWGFGMERGLGIGVAIVVVTVAVFVVLGVEVALLPSSAPSLAKKDTTPPSIIRVSLSFVNGISPGIYVNKTITDNVAVADVSATIVGPSPSTAVLGTIALNLVVGTIQNGSWTNVFPLPASAPDGTYTVIDKATDTSGNSITQRDGTVLVDRTPPAIVSASVFPPIVAIGGRVNVTERVTDSIAVGNVSASIVGPSPSSAVVATGTLSLIAGTVQDGSWNVVFSFPPAPNGTYAVVSTALDTSGNTASQTVKSMILDPVPPDTTVLSAVDGRGRSLVGGGRTRSTTVTVAFSGSDNVGLAFFECSLDGAPFSFCTSPVTYSSLTAGSHVFQVRAVDLAGNVDPTPASFTWSIRK